MANKSVVAVVVTYNRRKLLEECITAIINQSYQCDSIIIVDNNSSDGTDILIKELMEDNPSIQCVSLKQNTGGAGGFYHGMKAAMEGKFDFVWIMDDDTIPLPDCLEKLLYADKILGEDYSYLASAVKGLNDEPMNVPQILYEKGTNGYTDSLRYLKYGILEIGEATFVSLLIKTKAIQKVGLPWPDFFIWGDDSEYTYRLTYYYGKAYIVGTSCAIHKREQGNGLLIFNETNLNRIKMYYFFYRNSLIRIGAYGNKKDIIKRLGHSCLDSVKCITSKNIKYRRLKSTTICRAISDFVFRKYDTVSFKNRFKL